MSMRDYFAAAALQGIIIGHYVRNGQIATVTSAKQAYAFADAMLTERDK